LRRTVDHHYDTHACLPAAAYARSPAGTPTTPVPRCGVVVDGPSALPPAAQRHRGPARPPSACVFRDGSAVPAVTRGALERRGKEDDPGRTSDYIGGRGSVPAPRVQAMRRPDADVAPELSPVRPLLDERRRVERRREAKPQGPRQGSDSSREVPDGLRPSTSEPRSTGEPELRRRRP
jgi:hypothetical protein